MVMTDRYCTHPNIKLNLLLFQVYKAVSALAASVTFAESENISVGRSNMGTTGSKSFSRGTLLHSTDIMVVATLC